MSLVPSAPPAFVKDVRSSLAAATRVQQSIGDGLPDMRNAKAMEKDLGEAIDLARRASTDGAANQNVFPGAIEAANAGARLIDDSYSYVTGFSRLTGRPIPFGTAGDPREIIKSRLNDGVSQLQTSLREALRNRL